MFIAIYTLEAALRNRKMSRIYIFDVFLNFASYFCLQLKSLAVESHQLTQTIVPYHQSLFSAFLINEYMVHGLPTSYCAREKTYLIREGLPGLYLLK